MKPTSSKSGRVDCVMADSAAISDGLLKEGGDAFEFIGPEGNKSQVVLARVPASRCARLTKGSEREIQCRHPGAACQWQIYKRKSTTSTSTDVYGESRRQANKRQVDPVSSHQARCLPLGVTGPDCDGLHCICLI